MLKQKKGKKIRKRSEKRNNKLEKFKMKIFAANAAGIRSKTRSFNPILLKIAPKIWMLEETKLKPSETIKCEASNDFRIFYLNRQESQGG